MVRVWTPPWYVRDEGAPKVKCGDFEEHFADVWFAGCEHQPTFRDFLDSARALCVETGADEAILEVISSTYFTAWALGGQRHIEQWPLALIVLAGLREAGYEVIRPSRALSEPLHGRTCPLCALPIHPYQPDCSRCYDEVGVRRT